MFSEIAKIIQSLLNGGQVAPTIVAAQNILVVHNFLAGIVSGALIVTEAPKSAPAANPNEKVLAAVKSAMASVEAEILLSDET